MHWGNTWLLVVVVAKHLPGCGGCKEYWLFLVVVGQLCVCV